MIEVIKKDQPKTDWHTPPFLVEHNQGSIYLINEKLQIVTIKSPEDAPGHICNTPWGDSMKAYYHLLEGDVILRNK